MTFTLYDATVPQFLQYLGAVEDLLDKGEAFCAERGLAPEELLDARLIADMHPFTYQVKSSVVHSVGAIEGVRAGQFSPDNSVPPASFAALREHVNGAVATLRAIDPAELEGLIGRETIFSVGSFRRPFTAETFLMSFSLPNFYFHITTAYDLLRMKGVPVGKRDYLGWSRAKA